MELDMPSAMSVAEREAVRLAADAHGVAGYVRRRLP
jgi:hypothetical protein